MKRCLIWILALTIVLILAGGIAQGEAFAPGRLLEIVQCKEFVSLRREPGRKARKVKELRLGTRVLSLGAQDGEFTSVKSGSYQGWVLTEYLRPVDEPEGEELEISIELRVNMNLYLTAFTMQNFGALLSDDAAVDQLIQFSGSYLAYYQPAHIDEGNWKKGQYRARAEDVLNVIRQFFAESVCSKEELEAESKEGYLYWNPKEDSLYGFAVVNRLYDLGEGRIKAEFGVYGGEGTWAPEGVCMFTAKQASNAYPKNWIRFGVAIINTNGKMDDRSEWKLERYVNE